MPTHPDQTPTKLSVSPCWTCKHWQSTWLMSAKVLSQAAKAREDESSKPKRRSWFNRVRTRFLIALAGITSLLLMMNARLCILVCDFKVDFGTLIGHPHGKPDDVFAPLLDWVFSAVL